MSGRLVVAAFVIGAAGAEPVTAESLTDGSYTECLGHLIDFEEETDIKADPYEEGKAQVIRHLWDWIRHSCEAQRLSVEVARVDKLRQAAEDRAAGRDSAIGFPPSERDRRVHEREALFQAAQAEALREESDRIRAVAAAALSIARQSDPVAADDLIRRILGGGGPKQIS